MHTEVVYEHESLLSFHSYCNFAEEDHKLIAVDGLLTHVYGNNLTTAINSSDHSYGLKTYVLLLNKTLGFRREPRFLV